MKGKKRRLYCNRKVVVNSVREGELDRVFEIERLSFKNPYPPWYITFLYGLSGRYFLVARIGSEIVGYAVFIPLSNLSCHLANIAVAPGYRRKRIASCLLEAGEAHCRATGYKSIKLEVETTNTAALRLYILHGYKTGEVIQDYYGPNRHAIVMWKKIQYSI